MYNKRTVPLLHSFHLDALQDGQHFRVVGLGIDDRHADDLAFLLSIEDGSLDVVLGHLEGPVVLTFDHHARNWLHIRLCICCLQSFIKAFDKRWGKDKHKLARIDGSSRFLS